MEVDSNRNFIYAGLEGGVIEVRFLFKPLLPPSFPLVLFSQFEALLPPTLSFSFVS
jgi:hypothetical protein